MYQAYEGLSDDVADCSLSHSERWKGRSGHLLYYIVQSLGDFRAHWIVHMDPEGRTRTVDAFGGTEPCILGIHASSSAAVPVLAWLGRHSYDDDTDYQLHLFDLSTGEHKTVERPLDTFRAPVSIHIGAETVTATGVRSRGGRKLIVHLTQKIKGNEPPEMTSIPAPDDLVYEPRVPERAPHPALEVGPFFSNPDGTLERVRLAGGVQIVRY